MVRRILVVRGARAAPVALRLSRLALVTVVNENKFIERT
jgi:hypothetical protein